MLLHNTPFKASNGVCVFIINDIWADSKGSHTMEKRKGRTFLRKQWPTTEELLSSVRNVRNCLITMSLWKNWGLGKRPYWPQSTLLFLQSWPCVWDIGSAHLQCVYWFFAHGLFCLDSMTPDVYFYILHCTSHDDKSGTTLQVFIFQHIRKLRHKWKTMISVASFFQKSMSMMLRLFREGKILVLEFCLCPEYNKGKVCLYKFSMI